MGFSEQPFVIDKADSEEVANSWWSVTMRSSKGAAAVYSNDGSRITLLTTSIISSGFGISMDIEDDDPLDFLGRYSSLALR